MKQHTYAAMAIAVAVGMGLMGWPDRAAGAPITLSNPSFESNVVGNEGTAGVTSWTVGNFGGGGLGLATWNPPGSDAPDSKTYGFLGASANGTPLGANGINVLTIYSDTLNAGGRAYQDTTTPLTAGMIYTLTVAVGRRANGDAVNWGIDIMTTSQSLGTTGVGATYLARTTGTLTDLTSGQFVDKVVTFTATAGHPNLGQNLRIHLWTQGTGVGGQTSVGFDNVRLDATVADTTPPAISTLSPADGATGVAVSGNLVATFSENVQKGASGNIRVMKISDDSTVETIPVTSGNVTVNNATVTITRSVVLAGLTGYYVQIDSGAIKDLAGNSFAGITDNTTWNFTSASTDTIAPALSTLSPADNATGIAVDANLVAMFDENVQKGTGSITLRKTADNSEVETFDVASSPRVTVSSATVTIDPTSDLDPATGYYVQIDATAIKDPSGNFFAGIADTATWNFTSDATPPTISTLSPADEATDVALTANLVATFSENVQKGTGNITVKKIADNSTVETIAVTSGNVTVNNATVTIVRSVTLAGNTGYYVQIDAGAIKDLAGNSYAGIADTTTWNFTTLALYFDFATDPDIAGKWTQYSYHGTEDVTPTWNSTDQDLDLQQPASGQNILGLYRTGTTRSATDPVTLTVKDFASGGTWGYVALMISAGPQPSLTAGANRYEFRIMKVAAGFHYELIANFGADQIADTPTATFSGPVSLTIVRNGANYDFKVNGITLATGISFTSGQHDAMVYYEIVFGGDGAMTGTVDDFGIDTTPPTISTLNPADGATGVAVGANLVATFSENVQKGASGNITVKKISDDSTVETIPVTSGNVAVNNSTVTIVRSVALAGLTDYYVQIDSGAIKDPAGNSFAGIADTTTWNFTTASTDTTPPTISTLSPADNATEVAVGANLVATFDENIQKGTGNIVLKKSADNATVETFDVASSPRVTVSVATVTIDPTSNLGPAASYYLQIDATAIQDLSGNSFAGIADTTIWNFTSDATPPTISTLSPADNATAVAMDANLVATFSENVQKGTGNITVKKIADNSTVETIAVTSGNVTVNNATVTINPTGNLAPSTGYYVEIDSGAIQDVAGNNFAGLSGATAWNFVSATEVANPSFQIDVVADGVVSPFANNWTVATFGALWGQGTWNPSGSFTGDGGNGTPLGADGCNVFTIYGGDASSGGRIYQDTSIPLTARMTYTLTVAVGRRLSGDGASWGIELMTTSQTLGSQYLARLTGTYTDLTTGRFVDKTVSFTPMAGHPNLGQNLRVHFWSQGIDASHTSTGFDNVRLLAEPWDASLFMFR